jgi:hypothetical protein
LRNEVVEELIPNLRSKRWAERDAEFLREESNRRMESEKGRR